MKSQHRKPHIRFQLFTCIRQLGLHYHPDGAVTYTFLAQVRKDLPAMMITLIVTGEGEVQARCDARASAALTEETDAARGGALPHTTRPVIVRLCGSTRFLQAFQEATMRETLAGRIVLTISCGDTKNDAMPGLGPDIKARLDELHKRKNDLADELLVLNVDGYIGTSTRGEIDDAMRHGKRICWLIELAKGEAR